MTTDPSSACIVCRTEPPTVGRLCDTCRDAITAPIGILPQQILATCMRPTGDAIVDQWGRPHPLEDRTLIGRALEGAGLLILEASVSRHHAHLTRDPDGWCIRDLGSVNGTIVNDEAIDSARLSYGSRIAIGAVSFYLVLGVGDIPAESLEAAAITTVRSTTLPAVRTPTVPIENQKELDSAVLIDDEEPTEPGAPIVDLRIAESASGGGGVLELDGVITQLSANQARLMSLLAKRMLDEIAQPPFVRGFVRSSELLGSLPWDSPDPDDNHVKQLVRRTRRQLVRAGLGDLIEARQRFGYRLRLVPRE